MPFSESSEAHTEEYWTRHFESYLKPLIEQCPNVEAVRSEPLRVDVLKQIISELVVCPIVVADLTDRNPNVFWELGVRQSFKQGTITIAEEKTQIPFDVSMKGVLFYHPRDHIRNSKFEKKFRAAIIDCLSNPEKPDSQVLETISGRGTLFEIIHRDEATRRIEALMSENERNASVIERVFERIERRPAQFASRLRTPAVELLIANRYLDENSSFYQLAERYLNWILAMNERLPLWEFKRTMFKKWALRNKKGYYELSAKYGKALRAASKKIAQSY
jgi:hypothetical protein